MRIFLLIKHFLKYVYYKSIVKSEKYNEVLYRAVEELGGLYVKLAQFICLQTEIFSNADKIKFLSFYDRVPIQQIDLQQILMKELGGMKLANLKIIDTYPFASGAFAQVYKAVLNGTTVIIKVKRPNLKLALKIDFSIFKILIYVFNLFYYQTLIDLQKLLREFQKTTEKELNYKKEVENAAFFYRIYKHHAVVKIPQTFPEYCTNNIIVQEYVGGISLSDVIRLKNRQADYRTWLWQNLQTDIIFVIKSIPYELAIQGLLQDKFYADPHPGNIKILPNNRYAFIDFGILGITPRNKRTYYNIVELIRSTTDELDMKSLSREFLKFGSLYFYKCLKTVDGYFGNKEFSLTKMITDSYNQILEENKEKFKKIEIEEQENFTKMYLQIIELGQRFNVKIPEGLLSTIRSISIYKSYNEFLEPNLHPMREIYGHILHDVDKNRLVNYDDAEATDVPIEDAIETVLDWVHHIAETDAPLFFKITESLKQVNYA